ncbi:LysM peptidoglycan-binding domain-containing protein [Paenibacillus glycinis]|uniref:LysM peptidoglycan-binding domain-containing protein n=1 Tax=Paenibacillus glycinis TaxID=2697035 RepID=A0ABW9XTF8_9BACL|nr:LysM peptidoglycan-binding domain-containing protein [Paenibacillus glycinis]NBD25900.1 LysM peptidoglycan-binding domain-containing protein [Paenibacillus glycinis]
MPSQSNGLRFDIYERVHLPDEVAAIDELDEIELIPRIGIVQQDEQVLLKGHLLLTGVYRSEEQPLSEQSLEHWIPVEITLPLNRIHRLDDISVEIDNFDVDVLSTRTLNITGVLSLFGIEIEQANPQGEWTREEPYTVVHSREDEDPRQAAPPFFAPQEPPSSFAPQEAPPFFAQQPQFWQPDLQREAAEQEEQRYAAFQTEAEEAREALSRAARAREQELLVSAQQEAARQEAERQEAARQEAAFAESARQEAERQEAARQEAAFAQAVRQEAEPTAAFEEIERQTSSQPEEPVQQEAQAAQVWEQSPVAEQAQPDPASFGQPVFEPQIRQQPGQPAAIAPDLFGEVSVPESDAEPKPLRVALAGKPAEEEAAQQGAGNVTFRSLLQSSRREQEAKAAAEQHAEREAEQNRKTTGDDIEWKNLFYGRPSDENAFRKVRLCIVQREETLDVIAGRYQLQAREIALYNRLSDQIVSEGQVLYIP